MMKKNIALFFLSLLICNTVLAAEIPVKLEPLSKITTSKGSLQEGDSITLSIAENVYSNSRLFIKKGELATGIITSLENNDFTAQPASIYAEQFRTKSVDGKMVKLKGIVYKSGRTHSFVTQYLENGFQLIRGGEAKIVPKKDSFTLFWDEKNNSKKEGIDAL